MSSTIVLTGGGSGGHITPLLAVATELKQLNPSFKIVYIGQTGDKLGDIPAKHNSIDETYTIRAGKLRRYHGEGIMQVFDIPTLLKNIRDVFYVLIGIWQSRKLLKKLKPAVVFIKGGFVGVPVGLAAGNLKIPYITHDSDAIPGLANRIISGKASKHAVALPADVYDYPQSKTVSTGIPLQVEFKPVSQALKSQYRKDLGIKESARMLFVIGGGLGSQRVNSAVTDSVPHLLSEFPDLVVVHAVGRQNEQAIKTTYTEKIPQSEQGRVIVRGYIDDVYRYSGSADLVITRAGATNLAEFATQGRACIVIPSPFLAGGHQLKNARYLQDQQAAVVIDENELMEDSNRLAKQVSDLLNNAAQREILAQNLSKFAKPNATSDIAKLIIEEMKTNETR